MARAQTFGTLFLSLSVVACAPNPNDPPRQVDAEKELKGATKTKDRSKNKTPRPDVGTADKPGTQALATKDATNPAVAQPESPAEVGKPAPDFELKDLEGRPMRLSQHKGKTVVLEWFNPECPFVKYAHGGEGPLAEKAKKHMESGVVWLSINSGAPGKQGHGVEKNKSGAEGFGMANPVLIDESGEVGRKYGAKTTPHIFIVDAEGNLVFRGGVDNAPMGEVKEGGDRVDYVDAALADIAAGKPVGKADVKSYGCSVKYAS